LSAAAASPAPSSRSASGDTDAPPVPAVTDYPAAVVPPATAERVAAANPATRTASESPPAGIAAAAEDASAPPVSLALSTTAPAEAAAITPIATAGGGASDRATQSDTNGLPDPAAAAADGAPWGVNLTAVSPGATASSTPALNVSARVESPEFGQGVAERVSAMLDSNLTTAKLEVNPPQLGPIEVRITVQGDHAQVWLTSHSAVTRDALESSSSKLRDMLGAQGFGQVSVDISQRNFQERSAPRPYADGPVAAPAAPTAASVAATAPSAATRTLDAYA
jgi:flagellar hook-length control protein FliK